MNLLYCPKRGAHRDHVLEQRGNEVWCRACERILSEKEADYAWPPELPQMRNNVV